MLLLILVFVIFFYMLIMNFTKPKNYPSGPIFLPVIGSLMSLPAQGLELKIQEWKRKYGNIIGHKFGDRYLVIICGIEEIEEALKHPNFQGRLHSKVFQQRTYNKSLGFIFNDDESCFEMRRFTLHYFSQVFTTQLQNIMNDEIMNSFYSVPTGQIVDVDGIFFGTIPLNIMMKILVGISRKQFQYEIDDIQRKVERTFRTVRVQGIEQIFPKLGKLFHQDIRLASCEAIQHFMEERLREHKALFDSSHIEDYTDAFLLQQKLEKELNGSILTYTDEMFIACCLDMVQSASDNPGNVIGFILMYIAMNQRVQDRIHEEIDQVIGQNRNPTLEDRLNLRYVEATIYEGMRIKPTSPMGVIHRVTEDTKFRGYIFKKNTLIRVALGDTMTDPQVWKNPEMFIPERFLNCDRSRKKLINFGLGKRSCVAEILVKNMIFLYITYLFQKFSIKLPQGYYPSTVPTLGITSGPAPFKLIFTERY